MTVPFWKTVSVGNDFVLVRSEDVEGSELVELARWACRKKFGIGSDGLLVVDSHAERPSLRMFNPDGTEDFCGNGLRCAALFLRRGGGADRFVIRHGGKDVPVGFEKAGWIDVQLPPASWAPEDIPLAPGVGEVFLRKFDVDGESLTVSALSTGTAHTVVELDSPPPDDLFDRLSPKIEVHPWFPERTSVLWTWPEGKCGVRARVWERGVGETDGCGTGSAAIAAVRFRKATETGGPSAGEKAIAVLTNGGETAVGRGPAGSLIVSARAEIRYEGAFDWPPRP